MDYFKVREFHWMTWTVIGLLIALLVMLTIGIAYRIDLGIVVGSMAGILWYVFLLAFIWTVACIIGRGLKTWLEKYLDALVEQKSREEDAGAQLAVLNEKIEKMEEKIDRIEDVLTKVGE
ncbi:hypothetical protein [Methanofollis ethanolicus]|uniref:hypothetical protein n=1 Tax=Methanofollis ethanolicus TaxID=488124 RepID=UPI00128EDE14|nr:hypothetical protein [Methanofollis ethanolicus]